MAEVSRRTRDKGLSLSIKHPPPTPAPTPQGAAALQSLFPTPPPPPPAFRVCRYRASSPTAPISQPEIRFLHGNRQRQESRDAAAAFNVKPQTTGGGAAGERAPLHPYDALLRRGTEPALSPPASAPYARRDNSVDFSSPFPTCLEVFFLRNLNNLAQLFHRHPRPSKNAAPPFRRGSVGAGIW